MKLINRVIFGLFLIISLSVLLYAFSKTGKNLSSPKEARAASCSPGMVAGITIYTLPFTLSGNLYANAACTIKTIYTLPAQLRTTYYTLPIVNPNLYLLMP
ncbi:MAG: hypothetical protein WC489_05090 [Patescibacteria group bacterium]